ncbi:MAG TPA: glycosyltransferase family 4 protein [Bacteroidia bacterium]|jgi:glycosyltransferase involved in cell wall biosynthesis|nr:glycosyltransferase family 4 protein [Bacteroidia bacterium]
MAVRVICIHIGARAHYLLPNALEKKNSLVTLITDTWVSSGLLRLILSKSPIRMVKSFANRFSAAIPSKRVSSFSIRFSLIEIYLRLCKLSAWQLIVRRNYFFQRIAIDKFCRLPTQHAVLGISYTSLDIFRVAKMRDQKTILFQIDPGYKEEQIVADVANMQAGRFKTRWKPAPSDYWMRWKEECMLADVIMVNSEWTKLGLVEQDIDHHKIQILPLPFQVESKHINFTRQYPDKFTVDRPLRCLFLGTLTLRKGIHIVLDAAAKLAGYPVEFILVGENELDASLLNADNVKYKGVVSRSETDFYYQHSDVFLFPTLSDGFGLTQLEALSWQLPVIASKYCGEVIVNNFNGIILEDCNTDSLVKAIVECLNDIEYLKTISSRALETVGQFSTDKFAEDLIKLL